MKHVFVASVTLICLGIAGACGVKGDLVREPGTEPPPVAVSTIEDATTEPTKPRSTLF